MWQGNSTIFKGYAKGDGKRPIQKVDPKSLLTWDQVKNEPSFGGILQDGLVDISYDSEGLSDVAWDMSEQNHWNCLILENPSNGHDHTIWKKPSTWTFKDGKDKKLAVGLIADIHSGNTYIPLRVDGVDRFPPSFEPVRVDEVPEELFPVKTDINLVGLSEGNGRNETLFKYILVLQSQLRLSKETIHRILTNTNKFVFKDPLNEKEFDTITRDEAFCAPVFFQGKNFLHNVFGDYLMREMHIKRIKQQLHVYREGVYVSGYRYIENSMQKLLPSLKSTQRSEVLKYLEVMNPDDCTEDADSNCNLIPFNNGVLNINTMELLPFDPEYIITNKIPWNYNPDAYNQTLDKAMNQWSCNDPDIRSLLEECVGYCLYRKNNLDKSFILTGQGANGKSTFLDTVKALLTIKNYSALDLCEMDDRFSTVMMAGKLANIGDDISSDFLQGKTLSLFKKVVSGNEIKAENKGIDAITMKPSAKLLFSANTIPRMAGSKGIYAIKRRLVIIPFNATFSSVLEDGSINPEYDDLIGEKLKEGSSMEYLILLAVQGLKRALKNKGFTQSKKVKRELDEFEKENDPVLLWLDSMKEEDDPDLYSVVRNYICRNDLDSVYGCYSSFCVDEHYNPLTREMLSKELRRRFDLGSHRQTINGKKYTFLTLDE